MLVLKDKTATLAVRRGQGRVLYRRVFDRATAAWRYRAEARQPQDTAPWQDFTSYRARQPEPCARACALLAEVEALAPDTFGLDRTPHLAPPAHLVEALALYADFHRFFQVNALLVRQALAQPLKTPLHLALLVPPLNLALALDLQDAQAHMRRYWAPAIADLVFPDSYQDDAYTHGAGACRALAEIADRAGDRDTAYRWLARSQELRPSRAKAERLVHLAPPSERAARQAALLREGGEDTSPSDLPPSDAPSVAP